MLVFHGSPALSPFRLQKLLARLHQAVPAVEGVTARFVHLADLARDLTDEEHSVLGRLLTYGPRAPAPEGESVDATVGPPGETFVVVPRLGTISPWASKATDIAHACDLGAVRRVERGIVYRVSASAALGEAERARVAALLHDRMTESVLTHVGDAAALFRAEAPRPLVRVALGDDARAALSAADRALGLALSPDEIEYLADAYATLGRDPTDVELVMFAQANSEHCRHKIFNATWTIDGEAQARTLFQGIRATHEHHSAGVLSAYRDNAAVMEGTEAARFFPDPATGVYAAVREPVHHLAKVETHNHPTAISPFPGAATGSGGEIRDEGATGRGGKPKAGLVGFTTSALRIPGHERPWERDHGRPGRMASPLDIMLQGPLGGAAFNNEFGRPAILGYFRTYEQSVPAADAPSSDAPPLVRGFHKPIMLAGGLGSVRPGHVEKLALPVGARVIVLGGPALLIGLGGGAASSVASGESAEQLDFASVQRDNAELQRRAQEVLDACWARGAENPILSVHDVGAGGLSNAVPELLHGGGRGGRIALDAIPRDEPGLSPMEVWCNEAQERYVLAVAAESVPLLEALCRRERCPFAVIGEATAEERLVVHDAVSGETVVDLPLEVLLGKPPRMHRDTRRVAGARDAFDGAGIDLGEALGRVLRLPAVADKGFLVTIGDRTVGGLIARDPLVGPWQVPVSDVAVTTTGLFDTTGEAMALGERSPVAVLDAPASGRLAVGEALTNLCAADVGGLGTVRLSANWMAAAGQPGDDAALFDTVRAVGPELCVALGITIPVGKDSLSMRTVWNAPGADEPAFGRIAGGPGAAGAPGAASVVASPVSLVVTAFAPVADVRRTVTPELRTDAGPSELWLIDLGRGQHRLGGSALAQVYSALGAAPPDVDDPALLAAFFRAVQTQVRAGTLLAYHDRSDGGLVVCALEMAFAGGVGVELDVSALVGGALREPSPPSAASARVVGPRAPSTASARVAALFCEELGALVQLRAADAPRVVAALEAAGLAGCVHRVGALRDDGRFVVRDGAEPVFSAPLTELRAAWSETTWLMQSLRDDPDCAREEYEGKLDASDPGLTAVLTFDPAADPGPAGAPAPSAVQRQAGGGGRPRVAVLREQGVNGQVEMAAAFTVAGFEAVDVHMSDVHAGRVSLDDFQVLAACGGFSYGDVLGAGEGWAKSILFQPRTREAFARFFERRGTLTLGICNGCQMVSALKELIPGAELWPRFVKNRSEQFEARLALVEVLPSPSLFLAGMVGSRLPIAVAHGEGRAEFGASGGAQALLASGTVPVRWVDGRGVPATRYPQNPNGSPLGVAGVCSADGRVTLMMPHPERVFRTVQHSWHPRTWGEDGPWLRMFREARRVVG